MNTEESLERYDEETKNRNNYGEKKMNLQPGIEEIKREDRRLRNHALRGLLTLAIWTACVVAITVSICKWVMK